MDFVQQIIKTVAFAKYCEIKHFMDFTPLYRSVLSPFLFNKSEILFLFSAKDVHTFVSSKKTDIVHLPMDQYKAHNSLLFHPFFTTVKMLFTAAVILFCTKADAQGWEIYFGDNFDDVGHSLLQADNGDYLIAGYTQGFGAGNTAVYVVRTDVDGRLIWQRIYDEGHISYGYSIIPTDDDAFLIAGQIIEVPQNNQSNVLLLKIDNRGDLLWKKQYGGPENDAGWRIIPSVHDGGYLIVGRTVSFGSGANDIYLIKIDADGNQQWANTYGTTGDDIGRGVVETTDGYLVTGSAFNPANNSADIYLLKIDFDGNQQFAKYFGSNGFDEGQNIVATNDGNFAIAGSSSQDAILIKINPGGTELWSTTYDGALGAVANDLISTGNGDIVFTGVVETDASNSDAFLARYDPDGNQLWNKIIGRSFSLDWGQSLTQTSDKGFAVAGYNALVGTFFNDVTFIKAGPDGDVYTNILSGKIFIDDDEGCDPDPGEAGLNEWIVTARSANKTFFGTSGPDGNYSITLDTGAYEVSVFVKNNYWESCVTSYNVTFNNQYDTLSRNFPILKNTLCPLLQVDVSAPVAQNCSNIGYSVDYCNDGTEGVANPVIEIALDENLSLTGANIPFSTQGDSLYLFEIDSLGIGQCGNFHFSATSSCSGVPFEAYTVVARIFPDTICQPTTGWDMSDIRVKGQCDADSVRFTIKNEGSGNMQDNLKFIVIEDQILGLSGDFILNAGEEKETAVLFASGSTYRIIAEQAPGHPGNSYPTVAIEGCTTTGTFSTGFVSQLQEDENDPFVSADVQEAIQPTDYILMRGYPKGFLQNGNPLIPANTDLQYHIYFQNPTTDTLQRLVIRDTLPPGLELTSVVPGASSHPYLFEVYGNGVLRFTFENLNLSPDGDTASVGFVQFKVSQKPDNPQGTVIPNSAAVFSGYQTPAQTTTTIHVVGMPEPLIELFTFTTETQLPGVEVSAYPNPFTSSIIFEIKENRFTNLTLTVFDRSGRLVRRQNAAGNQIRLERGNLLAGFYTFRLQADGLLLNTGKIIVR